MKNPHAIDCSVKLKLAINEAIMNCLLRATQTVAKLTAIMCKRSWMEKNVKKEPASARNPAMK